jgi:hypothetical protein
VDPSQGNSFSESKLKDRFLIKKQRQQIKTHTFSNPVGKIPREFFPCNICDINLDCSSFQPKPNLSFSFDSENEFP